MKISIPTNAENQKGSVRIKATLPIASRTIPSFSARLFLGIIVGLFSIAVFLCPTGSQNALALEENEEEISITIVVEGYDDSLPVLLAGTDFTPGEAVKADPRFMEDEQGGQLLSSLIETKEAEGYQLVWKTDEGIAFDWFETPVTESITVIGSFEMADHSIHLTFNDGTSEDIEVSVPHGSSFVSVYGSIPKTPSKKGYEFIRWVNAVDNSTFDFSAPVTSSTSIYALFSISEPDQVVTVDMNADVPEKISGTCYIGATWSVHPARFSVSSFSGELEGCSGTGTCSLPSAAAPSYTWADYHATLVDIDVEKGIVTYDVTITPPGAAKEDGPRNSLGLIGYQTVYFQAKVQKNFGGYLELQKHSSNPSLSEENNTYSLKNAVFGIYDKNGSRVAQLTTDSSGKSDRSPLLPVGTYTIREEQAPAGYADAPDKAVEVIAGAITKTTLSDIPQSALVDLVLQKLDAETGEAYPLGGASLAKARFRISYYDDYLTVPSLIANAASRLESSTGLLRSADQSALFDSWGAPKRSWIFETDETGALRFAEEHFVEGDDFYYDLEGAIVLPLGTIMIEEIAAPEGYLSLEDPLVVSLTEKGSDPHIEAWQCIDIPEHVKRGDISFTKVREGSMDRLANIAFRITSNSTGESHILVTDENGMASTEASWVPHSTNTNAGASSNDGIWFGSDALGNIAPVNDELGALPYDTYTIEELPCAANEGMIPIAFEVTIARDSTTLDLGTIDNVPYAPEISAEIDKRQTAIDDNGLFIYSIDYRSTSPTWADELTTTDVIACAEDGLANLEAIATPVSFGDYDGKMNVWYRTGSTTQSEAENTDLATERNADSNDTRKATEETSDDDNRFGANACDSNPHNPDNPDNERVYDFEGWRLWKQDVSTLEPSLLFTKDLGLPEEERVIAIAFEYGCVEEGFTTLPHDDTQWTRRDRYSEDDTLKESTKNEFSSWDDESCNEVIASAWRKATFTDKESTTEETCSYSPALLFMEADEGILEGAGAHLYNDATVDIFRNIELHDKDADSVKQSIRERSKNPLENIVSDLPRTSDASLGAIAITAALCALLLGLIALAKSALSRRG